MVMRETGHERNCARALSSTQQILPFLHDNKERRIPLGRAAHRGPFFGVLAETIAVPRGGRQVDLALRDQAVGGRKVDFMKESYHKIGIGL
jgi:hypothetical protein